MIPGVLVLLAACAIPDLAPVDAVDVVLEPIPAPSGVVRFVAVGDTGTGSAAQREVAAGIRDVCARMGCDFALLLGDNLYPDGMESPSDPRMDEVFTSIYGDLGLTFHAVLGNHDYGRRHLSERGEHQLAWARGPDRFTMPASYYRFAVDLGERGRADFFALDTDAAFWTGVDPQGPWLDATLGTSDARWRVVFAHHPWRSDGTHGNAGAYEGWRGVPYSSGSAVRTLYEQHVKGRAHLVLAGHDHNLQVIDHQGSTLIVSGAGSSSTPLVDRGNRPVLAASTTGFAWVELGDALTVRLHDATGASLGEHVVGAPPADAAPGGPSVPSEAR